ncbi:MAG: type II secretion system F family protein [Candidatus Methylacidiphilales bacterium]|nr:type II secretion system F family protein [Candidatus Methylacidiphilales bacterium]
MAPELILFGICLVGALVLAAMAIASANSGPSLDVIKRLETLNPKAAAEVKTGQAEANKKPTVDYKKLFANLTGQAYMEKLEKDLVQSDIRMKVGEFLLFRVFLVIITFVLIQAWKGNFALSLFAAGLAAVAHIPFMWIKRSMRISKFVNQLAEFLVLITNSLRAGQTFLQGIDIASRESPDPIGMEFRQLLKETNLGVPVEEAFGRMLVRVPSEDLKIVMSAFSIQRNVGGNLADIMAKVSSMIRQRIQIAGQIAVLTTQGKLSGAIVGMLPVGLGFIVSLMNYRYMSLLWDLEHPEFIEGGLGRNIYGPGLLGIGIFMQLLGCFVIYKICDIEV